jgi:hypothetical protein
MGSGGQTTGSTAITSTQSGCSCALADARPVSNAFPLLSLLGINVTLVLSRRRRRS